MPPPSTKLIQAGGSRERKAERAEAKQFVSAVCLPIPAAVAVSLGKTRFKPFYSKVFHEVMK
jgi:hypothetical protein